MSQAPGKSATPLRPRLALVESRRQRINDFYLVCHVISSSARSKDGPRRSRRKYHLSAVDDQNVTRVVGRSV